jgi:hypothetical protein
VAQPVEINIPEVKRTVIDYEFVFSSGMGLQVTVDPEAGDSVEYVGGLVHIHIAPKASLNDPTQTTAAEDHTVFLRHVASSLKKERIVVELTKEQKDVWRKVYREVSKSVN